MTRVFFYLHYIIDLLYISYSFVQVIYCPGNVSQLSDVAYCPFGFIHVFY